TAGPGEGAARPVQALARREEGREARGEARQARGPRRQGQETLVPAIDPNATGTAIDRMRKSVPLERGPGVLEWKAPSNPPSVKQVFDALGMGSIVDSDRE